MGLGFLMLWKQYRWKQSVGSLYMILGYPSAQWLDWPFLGVALMICGFMLALGLLEAFFALTVGRLFSFLGG